MAPYMNVSHIVVLFESMFSFSCNSRIKQQQQFIDFCSLCKTYESIFILEKLSMDRSKSWLWTVLFLPVHYYNSNFEKYQK